MADEDSKLMRRRILEELDALAQTSPSASRTWEREDTSEHALRVRESEYLIESGFMKGGVGGDHWVWGRITAAGREYLQTLRSTLMSTVAKFTIATPSELPMEWKELARGIAIQHDFNVEPYLTNDGILLVLTTHAVGEEVRIEAERVATEIERAIGQPSRVRGHATSNVFINHGQAGAMGPNASARGNTFQQQVVNATPAGIEERRLIEQLARLVDKLKAEAHQPSDYTSLAEVAQAQLEAMNGDRSGVAKSLKRAGAWVYEIAEKIGVDIVVGLIKDAM